MMTTHRAHYLLFTEATASPEGQGSSWRFVLERVGIGRRLSVSDVEAPECLERLELLAVVRGLEALDEPARVTLVTKSRYVSRGLKFGLAEWKAADWQWERFGRMTAIRDQDLWRRVDVALRFHRMECRLWRFDGALRSPDVRGDSAPRRLAEAARSQLRRVSAAAASWGGALQGAGLAAG